jgi:hypothetical protein
VRVASARPVEYFTAGEDIAILSMPRSLTTRDQVGGEEH